MDEFSSNVSMQGGDHAVRICGRDHGNCRYYSSSNPSNEYLHFGPNRFAAANPVKGHVSVGDFDGDGVDDLFLASGAAWYYSPGGKVEWRFLSGKPEGADELLFGDFDGDGRTDVITVHDNQPGWAILVSWAGTSDWEVLNESAPGPIADMAVGDFIGDQRPDIFFADASQWYVSDRGRQAFVLAESSSYRVRDLRFGDFDGDGKTDVFGVVAGKWQYSKSATGLWTRLRSALAPTSGHNVDGLLVADLDGDGRADVLTECPDNGCWRISFGGVENWTRVPQGARFPSDFAGAGHFLVPRGQGGADILSWAGRTLEVSIGGLTPSGAYNRQEMF